ncbi:MAG TPA: hypothetical protein VFF79_13565 [Conexibacter sp.]|jgi:hypothetical protein|nr:hypothetical protein [Conexibacter sp.]
MKPTRQRVAVMMSLAVAGAATLAAGPSASGTSSPRVGVVYGGRTSQGSPVWLRLRADRRAITILDFDWKVPASHCTNGRPMTMPENFDAADGFAPIKLHGGRFSGTIPEAVGAPDGSGSERFKLSIAVTDTTVHATFSATVHVNVATGGHYDCTLGRASLSADN